MLHRTGECLASLADGSGASAGTDTALGDLYASFHRTLERHAQGQCTVAILALAKSGEWAAAPPTPTPSRQRQHCRLGPALPRPVPRKGSPPIPAAPGDNSEPTTHCHTLPLLQESRPSSTPCSATRCSPATTSPRPLASPPYTTAPTPMPPARAPSSPTSPLRGRQWRCRAQAPSGST